MGPVVQLIFPDLGGVRILFIEDHDDTREAYGAIFRHCGAAVTEAASATEALEHLDSVAPAIVVTDLALPDDVMLLVPKLRERRVPAIAVTGSGPLSQRVKVAPDTFRLILFKPILPTELCATVKRVLAGGR